MNYIVMEGHRELDWVKTKEKYPVKVQGLSRGTKGTDTWISEVEKGLKLSDGTDSKVKQQ
jgi:uncharacterized protein (UPF0276 family)